MKKQTQIEKIVSVIRDHFAGSSFEFIVCGMKPGGEVVVVPFAYSDHLASELEKTIKGMRNAKGKGHA